MDKLNLDPEEIGFTICSSDDFKMMQLTLEQDHSTTTAEFIEHLKHFIEVVEEGEIDFHEYDFERYMN